MKFNIVIAGVLLSALIKETYARGSIVTSEKKHREEPPKPEAPNQKNEIIKPEKSHEEIVSIASNSTVPTPVAAKTTSNITLTTRRFIPKRCLRNPHRCRQRSKERLRIRERKREEKRKLKERRKREKENKRAEKQAWKEKKERQREERRKRKERDDEEKAAEDQEIEKQEKHKGSRKKDLSRKSTVKPTEESVFNMTDSVPTISPAPASTDSTVESTQLYYYDYESEKSTESHISSAEAITIEKRSQWRTNRRFRKACEDNKDCTPDECCITKVNGSKVCSKKDAMRLGRRCVDSCTCAGELLCYRPNIRNARTGDLTPRREYIGRCTTKKEVNIMDGVVLPRSNKSED